MIGGKCGRCRRTHLLVYVTSCRSPPVHPIIALNAIHRRLRVDSQVPELVHLGELVGDHRRLRRWRLGRPRQLDEVAAAEAGKECRDVGKGGRMTPEGVGLGGLWRQRCTRTRTVSLA